MNLSVSEENYIKNIYHLQAMHERVSTTLLAAMIRTKAASVTDMLKKLQKKKLVEYEPYKSFVLTEDGLKLALSIIRKHRLWEFFLVEKLNFHWNEVHEIAEQLEHIHSPALVTRLDAFLDFPSFDPHGDPIPNSRGKMTTLKRTNLLELPLKKNATVSYIKDQSDAMLELLKHYKINIGSKMKVIRRFEFDGSVEIKQPDNPVFVLSELVAKNIYCVL